MAGKNSAPRKQKKKPVDLRDLAVGESTDNIVEVPEPEVVVVETEASAPEASEPKAKKNAKIASVHHSPSWVVPGVYRESGFFVLAISVDPQEPAETFMLHTYVEEEKRFPRFGNERLFSQLHLVPMPSVDPYELALSLLVRTVVGSYSIPAAVERRLLAMLSKEALMVMSERRLGSAYRDVMGKGPARIPANEEREALVDQLLAKLRETTNAKLDEEGKVIVKAPKKKREPKPKKEKKVREPKPPREKREPGAPRKPRTPRARSFQAADNLFREGTKKYEAFSLFLKYKGEERDECVAKMEALGVTPSTAISWYGSFWKLCEAREK